MTIIILIIVLLSLFFLATLSPMRGDRVNHHTHKHVVHLKKKSEKFWRPITIWAHGSLEFIRKSIDYTIRVGKRLRKKLPF